MKLWEAIKEIQEDDSKVFYKDFGTIGVVIKMFVYIGKIELREYVREESGRLEYLKATNFAFCDLDTLDDGWELEEKVSTLNEILGEGCTRAKLSKEIVSAIISKFEEVYNPENWDDETVEDIASIEAFCHSEQDINYIVYKTSGYIRIDILKKLLTSKCWIGVR